MELEVDSDGDIVVSRKRHHSAAPRRDEVPSAEDSVLSEVHLLETFAGPGALHSTTFSVGDQLASITIVHRGPTPLRDVGLQVWHGSLLLADYLLSLAPGWAQPPTLLELGAGTGVTSIALAAAAPVARAFVTDAEPEVLHNCGRNWRANGQAPGGAPDALAVRRLDWLHPPDWLISDRGRSSDVRTPPESEPSAQSDPGHEWSTADIASLESLSYVLAADCVYDDPLTDGLMRVATALLGRACSAAPAPKLLVALERRPCFTLAALEVRAPAYEHWRSLFDAGEEREGAEQKAGAGGAARGEAGPSGGAGAAEEPASLGTRLRGRRIDLAGVPQSLQPYARSGLLELWELWLPGSG